MDIIQRYKTQNTKGFKGIKKVISEKISIYKYFLKYWYYKISILKEKQ